jgi:hypothetical protein
MNIYGAEVYPGCACPHSTGKGCNDYANRPIEPCHHFDCVWVLPNSPLPDWFKPSTAKVIVLLNKTQWQGLPVDLAVPVGKRIPPRALAWLKQFAEQYGRPLLYTEQVIVNGKMQKQQEVIAYGSPAFQTYVNQKLAQQVCLWI